MNIFDVFPEIKNNKIFENVDEKLIKKYLCDTNLQVLRYQQGEQIISPESKEIKIGIVLHGSVEIMSSVNSSKVLLKTSGRGTIFGIANLYAQSSFPTSIVSKSDAEILFISPEIFCTMLESDSRLMRNFLKFLSKKILYLNKKIISYTAGTTEQKLAYFLSENELEGELPSNIRISDIAVMLNMGRASLYRALDKLSAQGIIVKDGRNIKIINKTKLKKIYISN